MSKVLYYPILLFIYLFSLLPKKFLYFLSDISAWMIRVVFRYRLSVVITNIARSFPEKKYKEILEIVKRSYRNFTDNFFEMIWAVSAPKRKSRSMVTVKNLEVMKSAYEKGGSALVVLGHQGNWEQMLAMDISPSGYRNEDLRMVYKKMNSKLSDILLHWIRGHRSSGMLVEMNDIARYMFKNKDKKLCYIFIADQAPLPGSKYLTEFLHQPTRMISGPDQLSRKLGIPVMYLNIERVKRGRYVAAFNSITEDPAPLPEGEIAQRFASLLEAGIVKNPSDWLWTHRRWKRDN
jgi:Kdo2-lipid IVA lauroyltransferase/acyltransferase